MTKSRDKIVNKIIYNNYWHHNNGKPNTNGKPNLVLIGKEQEMTLIFDHFLQAQNTQYEFEQVASLQLL